MERHEASQTIKAVMEQIRSECRPTEECEQPVLPETALATLSSFLPTVLNSALHIVDHGKVTKFVCVESKRSFLRVQESQAQSQASAHSAKPIHERTSSGAVYYDLIGDFCHCFFFINQCLSGSSGSSIYCKHIVAAKLAEALGENFEDKLLVKEIADQDFQPLFLSSNRHNDKFSEKR